MEATATEVTFWETIDHLGGPWVLLAVVVGLAVFYVVLVEVMIPRGRISQAERMKASKNKLRNGKEKPSDLWIRCLK
ncbi:hypothetical protein Ae201684P_009580 [Aphanomyces euteiches]|nr:hypothetical protein Ae201684P_009580 [Aphanomyces euteiches]